MKQCSRREFLGAMSMVAGATLARPALLAASPAPSSRVAIGMCPTYDSQVAATLAAMFDQLGGLRPLVGGKTVAIKLNMTGPANDRFNAMPNAMTHWVHPEVIGSLLTLLDQAGARRIRLLESAPIGTRPLEEFMLSAGWQPRDFTSAARHVKFENTNFLGSGRRYATFMVPGGGLLYKGYDLNHCYHDTDVFISLAKLKEHRTAGVTLSMKNCFGITPVTVYGEDVPQDEPALVPTGYRSAMHSGSRVPPKSAPQPVSEEAANNHDPSWRVPRITADLVAARPIHLAVIDGVYSLAGGELPNQSPHWVHEAVHPGVLIAGLNCVCTDAVATAVMGFDPMADRGTPPFETCDSTLHLAEQLGVGTRDLSRIEVVGTSITQARYPYRPLSQMVTA